MKKCIGCGREHPLEEFTRDRTRPDGRRERCRSCRGLRPIEFIEDGYKRCSKCSTVKAFEEFSGGNRTKNGLQSWCRLCTNTYLGDWRRSAAGKQSTQSSRRQMRYGLDGPSFQALVETQSGLCAICKEPPVTARGNCFYVDHDHQTGAVRGLLCHPCNSGLGFFKDSPERLQAAQDYLASRNL